MKISADPKAEGPEGVADWVDAWSEDYGLGDGIDSGLVDELRLIVYPLIAGPGTALFATTERRTALTLRQVETLDGGRVRLAYGVG